MDTKQTYSIWNHIFHTTFIKFKRKSHSLNQHHLPKFRAPSALGFLQGSAATPGEPAVMKASPHQLCPLCLHPGFTPVSGDMAPGLS